MNTSKVILTVISAVAILTAGASGQDPAYDLNNFEFENSTADKATQYSIAGTFLPIIAGIAWWAIDDADSVYDYDAHGHLRGAYTKDPDRMIPVMLIISGVVIGPSIGYFYGDCKDRGISGILIRTGAGMLTMMAGAGAASSSGGDGFCDYSGMAAGFAVGMVGAGLIIVEAIYDISQVKSHVTKRNIQKARQAATSVSIYPKYFADSGASGLQLDVNF